MTLWYKVLSAVKLSFKHYPLPREYIVPVFSCTQQPGSLGDRGGMEWTKDQILDYTNFSSFEEE